VKRAFSVLLMLLAIPVLAQVVMEEVGTISDQIEKAGDSFKVYKFDKTVEILNGIISTLEEWEKNGSLQESDEALYKKALELRAVSYFHLGKDQNSKEDFTKLIRLDPDYNVEITSSTKILRLYNTIKDGMAGALILEIYPSDADLSIDGKSYSGNKTARLLEGLHVLKASSMGYNSFSKEIQVFAGKSVSETITLKPNARKVYFFIKPQGAKLFVDGRLAGSADVPAAKKEDWAAYVRDNDLNPASFFAIEALYLPPGDHKVEIVAPCHAVRKFSLPVALDAVDNKPGYIKPIELEKETLLLRIDSYPKNAAVEIDGEKYGTTPLEIKSFCSGEHIFKVYKEGQGEYDQRMEFKGVSSYELTAKLRPTLLWAGLTKDQEVAVETYESFRNALISALPRIPSFNLVISREENPFLPDTFYTKGVSPAEQQKTVRELCAKYKTEGLLVSKLTSEGEKVTVSFRLYVQGFDGYDETSTLLLDAKDPSFIFKKFDPQKDDAGSPLGLYNDGGKGVLVLRSASCPQTIFPGDRIISAGGGESSAPDEIIKAVESGGEDLALLIQRGPETKSVNLKKMQRTSFFQGSGTGYRKLWLLYNQEVLSSENESSMAVSKLNLASVEISLGRNEQALEILSGLSFSGDTGCLSPTCKYLKAVVLLNLNRTSEAKTELTDLKNNFKDSYLGNDGRILLLPLVEDLLNNPN
jgi:hypothetical protein